MDDDDRKQEPTPTQQTQPKGIDPKTGKSYEPVEIRVPKRSAFDRLLKRAERPDPTKGAQDIYGDNWSDSS